MFSVRAKRKILLASLFTVAFALCVYYAFSVLGTLERGQEDSEGDPTFSQLYSLLLPTNLFDWVLEKKSPTIEELRDLLAHEDKNIRDISAILLLERTQFNILPLVLQTAADARSVVRQEALYTLRRVPPEQLAAAYAPSFVGALMQREDVIRNEALFFSCFRILLHVADTVSIQELENVIDRPDVPESFKVYILARVLDLGSPSPQLLEEARRYLASPHPDRVSLARHLARAGDKEAIAILERWLSEPGVSQKQKIEGISPVLLEFESEVAETYLLELIQRERDYRLLYRAASLLARYGCEAGFTKLLEGYKSENARVREYVVEQMSRSGDDRFLEVLRRAKLHDPDPAVRTQALLALHNLKAME